MNVRTVGGCSGRAHDMVRSRLYRGLRMQAMEIGPLAEDERLKFLPADHLILRKRGGAHTGDNLAWACRTCNSSKCARDALVWLVERNQFPPLLVLRRYLKLAIEMCQERNLMEAPLIDLPELPFDLLAISTVFPPPCELRPWITELR
jgi:HNH endonuclease